MPVLVTIIEYDRDGAYNDARRYWIPAGAEPGPDVATYVATQHRPSWKPVTQWHVTVASEGGEVIGQACAHRGVGLVDLDHEHQAVPAHVDEKEWWQP